MTSESEEKAPRTNLPQNIDAWRVFRILSEFVDGFEKMTSLGPSVVLFGSAQVIENDPYYKLTLELAYKIAKKGFAITTGGGPGLMEAANHGAKLAGGRSCGLCIDLPDEEEANSYIDRKYLLKFRYFFVRKVMFVRYAQAFVAVPGGFGTVDELFEALTLIQTGKVKRFPIYLVGKSYWKGLLDWLEKTMVGNQRIPREALNLVHVTDDLDEVANGIQAHYEKVKSFENF